MLGWLTRLDKCSASMWAGAIAGLIAGAGAGAGIASAIPIDDDRKFWLVVGLSIAGALLGLASGWFGGRVAGGCLDHHRDDVNPADDENPEPEMRVTRSGSSERVSAPRSSPPKSGEATG